jgi:nicotinamidase-related amidase
MEDLIVSEPGFIDIKKTALVTIDLQKGIVNRELYPYSGVQVVQNTSRLVEAFTQKGGFVVLVRVSSVDGKDMLHPPNDIKTGPIEFPKGWDDYIPELEKYGPVYHITKRQWGAFYGTDLDLQLRRRGIERIALCGISTGIGVDTTAREAFQRGYHQIFVEDAMTAVTEAEHQYVCTSIFPKIGQIRTTEEVIKLLGPPEF